MCGSYFKTHEVVTVPVQSHASPATNIEPVAVNFRERSPRKTTVEALWKRLQECAVVHIRGTPASGKSTLARLLHLHVRRVAPDMEILSITWPLQLPEGFGTYTPYYQLLNLITRRDLALDDWLEKRIVIIIDEAQLSYPFTNFWNDLIKNLTPGHGPCVALFCSYGSATSWAQDSQTHTPVLFTARQRISLRRTPANPEIGLLFSPEEFHDVINRVCNAHGEHGQLFLLSDDLKDYIFQLTSGHPAAVRSLLDGLASSDVRGLPGPWPYTKQRLTK